LYLSQHGCNFEIVPGVTSAIAAAAYAGIPVTHRDAASSVAFITGHEKPGKAESSIRWHELARGVDTLVFLMGVENLSYITENLITAGRPADTPAALVRNGTLPEQEVLTSTLGTIVQKSVEHGFKPPAVLIVGAVVGLRDSLAWAEKLSLWGRRIVVTRPAEQSADFIAHLQALGASVIELPTIEIRKAPDLSLLHAAFAKLPDYSWLIFTSRNGVEIFFEELFAKGLDARSLHGLKLCAIGPATADCLRLSGLMPDIVPDDYRAEGLLEALKGKIKPGDKVLLPRARGSRDVLPEGLKKLGAQVDALQLYEAAPPENINTEAVQEILTGHVDLITFTSSSTVTGFAGIIGREHLPQVASRIPAACIGPITAATAREHGFSVAIEAAEYTMDGMLASICTYFHKEVSE
jgi:uroporphyrinogen III methyltransferase/synthase